MLENLLATKLNLPAARKLWVSRPRLLTRLDEALRAGHRLILVSAPAGYGKTTLLGDWLRARQLPAAWISLDEADNDPTRFIAYLASALQALLPTSVPQAEIFLGSAQHADDPGFLAPLLNELAQRQHPCVLVLDDYHVITNGQVHRGIAFLLEHLPERVHLAIATRADPPLPIARLRGRGQLTELRLADLRFQPAEAAELLHGMTGQPLEVGVTEMLAARTEGWAAGLQMAGASLQRTSDVSRFLSEFSGSHRHILDYLLEEVLQGQPPAIQDFLLRTAILDRLSAPLCDYLLSTRDHTIPTQDPLAPASSQATLEYLEHANLFIVPLDNQRSWYRYHRLFSDLLRNRLQHRHSTIVSELHQRASQWYAQHGSQEAAIHHALEAGDYPRAAGLMEAAAEPTFMRSEIATFLSWIDRLPERYQRDHPALVLYCAWARLWNGAPMELVEANLAEVARAADREKISVLRAFLATMKGELELAQSLTIQALSVLPPEEHFQRTLAKIIQASLALARGETTTGLAAMERAAQDSQRRGNILLAALVVSNMADFRKKQGHLTEAERLYHQALQLATTPQGHRYPIAGRAMLGLGDLARHRNELSEAEEYLTAGVELARAWSRVGIFMGQASLIRVYQNQGKLEQAFDLLAELRATAEKTEAYEVDDLVVDLAAADLAFEIGDLDSIRLWAASHGFAYSSINPLPDRGEMDIAQRLIKYEAPLVARLWLADDQPQAARQLLETYLAVVESSDRLILLVEYLATLAIIYAAIQQDAQAEAALQRAIALAAPEGLRQIFLDLGAPMQSLLQRTRQQISKTDLSVFVDRLLIIPQPPTPSTLSAAEPSAAPIPGFFEALTARECEVLRLFPSRLSSREMAERLVISVHTLRSHIKSIYGKLDVHSRYEAVTRARELGLLD